MGHPAHPLPKSAKDRAPAKITEHTDQGTFVLWCGAPFSLPSDGQGISKSRTAEEFAVRCARTAGGQ